MATKGELLKTIKKHEATIETQKATIKNQSNDLDDLRSDVAELENRTIFALPKEIDNITNNSILEEFFNNIHHIDFNDFQVFINEQTT